MRVGFVGLGKMGKNLVLHLLEQGTEVVVWNRSPEPVSEVVSAGAIAATDIPNLVSQLSAPRIVWVMLPAGEVTNSMLQQLSELLSPQDILIDGANSNFNDTLANAKVLSQKHIRFLDAGTSGGPGGARNGACIMVGGDKSAYTEVEWLFKALAAPEAYSYFGHSGAGHFVKMIHNGIEYGMMQAIAEGFDVLKASQFQLDLPQVTDIYSHQSVISSRLIDWLKSGFAAYGPQLSGISGSAQESGEGRWTIETAAQMGIPTPVISASLEARKHSQSHPSFQGQIIQTLRNQFGGHKA